MKVYAIFANDNTKGTTHKMFSHAVTALESAGHDIDILNLYDREKEIPFFRHDRAYMESHPFYIENKERFLQADTLLIVFPLFWYSVPGILKTWIDMINGWAYKYESGLHAKPLHHIKKVMIFYSAMQDKHHLENKLQNPIKQQLTETFKFIGIDNVTTYLVDNVTMLSSADLDKHLLEISKICIS